MDTLSAFARAQSASARKSKFKVFDWDKAAHILRERNVEHAAVGLCGDWEWTGGMILEDGKPTKEDYVYLCSNWATPELDIDGECIPCWRYLEDSEKEDYSPSECWPQSALDIFEGRAEYVDP